MRFGLGRLRLQPEQFWNMTPLELDAAVRAYLPPQSPNLDRSALNWLINAFPDQTDGTHG